MAWDGYESHRIKENPWNISGPNSPIKVSNAKGWYHGSVWRTNEGYNVQVLDYKDKKNVLIRFENGYETYVSMNNLKMGTIKNPYHPQRHGGWFGVGPYGKRSHLKIYHTWANMLGRTNDETREDNVRNHAYEKCTVCDEWRDYQIFATWFDQKLSQLNQELYSDYQLDKDILQQNMTNKIYSPQTCCVVPSRINLAMSNADRERVVESHLPIGVHKNNGPNGKYMVNISLGPENPHPWLGVFETPEEAFIAYKIKKEEYIRELANKYYSIGALSPDIYNILMAIDIKPF